MPAHSHTQRNSKKKTQKPKRSSNTQEHTQFQKDLIELYMLRAKNDEFKEDSKWMQKIIGEKFEMFLMSLENIEFQKDNINKHLIQKVIMQRPQFAEIKPQKYDQCLQDMLDGIEEIQFNNEMFSYFEMRNQSSINMIQQRIQDFEKQQQKTQSDDQSEQEKQEEKSEQKRVQEEKKSKKTKNKKQN